MWKREATNLNEDDFENTTDLKIKMAMAKHAALSIAAAIMQVPAEVYTTPPMIDPYPPTTEEERRIRRRISTLLESGWDSMAGFDIPSSDTRLVDETMNSTMTDHNPSTYGEITELGARQLFHYMGIAHDCDIGQRNKVSTTDSGISFFDLGCGNGKLVIQAFMEVTNLKCSRGVELAPSRLMIAKHVWGNIENEVISIRQDLISFKNKRRSERLREKESIAQEIYFDQGDLFMYDISDATHIYVASLCFTDDMMKRLGLKIIDEASRLCCIATLTRFPVEVEEQLVEPRQEYVEMSWTKSRGQGGVVYFYQMIP
jgi:hypothetical protein